MASTYNFGTSSVNRPSTEDDPVHGGHAANPITPDSLIDGHCLPSSPRQRGSGQAMPTSPFGLADMDNGGRTTISPLQK